MTGVDGPYKTVFGIGWLAGDMQEKLPESVMRIVKA